VNPDGQFTAWSWHPDDVRFASGSDKGRIYLWNTLNSNCQDFGAHNYYTDNLMFSPRGDLLTSYGWDSTTRIWDAQTGRLMLESQSGYGGKFSRTGHRLAFYRENGELGFWPVISPQIFRTLNTQVTNAYDGRPAFECDFSPDGRFLLWSQNDGLRWLDIVSGQIGYQELSHTGACSFNPDGTSLISGSDVGLLAWPIKRQTNAVSASLRLGQPEPVGTPQIRRRPAFAISQDGQMIVRGGPGSWVISEARGIEREMKYPNGFDWANHVFISPDKRWVAMGFWGGSAFVLDARDGRPLKEFTDVRAGIMAFTPDGRWLVTCNAEEYRFWECGSWRPGLVIKRDLASRASGSIAFSRDGRKIAIARTEYLVQLLDPKTGEVLADLTAPNPQEIHHLSFSPNNTLLAVAGADGMQLWDLRTLRQELATLHLDWLEPALPAGPPALAALVFHEKLDSAVPASPVIPSRPTNAHGRLLDLTSFYTAPLNEAWGRNNNLPLPVGLQALSGVQYDIRGVIWLGSHTARARKLEGIPVRQQCRRLHFLHTTAWELPVGTEIGSYRVHYSDGQRIEIPIVHGRDVRNWWLRKGEGTNGEPAAIWTGTNALAASQGYEVNIFHSIWENPRPSVEILRLDFVSANTQCPPCLLAITAE
jgi:WD40 repeat protein